MKTVIHKKLFLKTDLNSKDFGLKLSYEYMKAVYIYEEIHGQAADLIIETYNTLDGGMEVLYCEEQSDKD